MTPSKEQQAVIDWAGTDLAVLAGPGSGKTATIVNRIKATKPEILAETAVITFTVAAAGELKSRLDGVKVGFIGTLHSWCRRFLEVHGEKIGIPSPFTVASAFDADEALAAVLEDSGGKVSEKALRAAISWKDFVTGKGDSDTLVGRLARVYIMRLWQASKIDYDGLLQLTLHLLREGSQPFHRYLYVDEAQDSSDIDWAIYGGINPKVSVIVGDYHQAIYEWRGASPKIFVAWANRKDVDVLMMNDNYRSTVAVCNASNMLMRRSTQKLSNKKSKPITKSLGVLDVRSFDSNETMKWGVVEWAKAVELEAKKTWAILCRSNREVMAIRGILKVEGIVTDDKQVTGAVNRLQCILDVIINTYNDAAAVKALKVLVPNIDSRDINRLLIECRTKNERVSGHMSKHLPEMDYAPFIRETPCNIEVWRPFIDSGRYPEIKVLPSVIAALPEDATIEDIAQALTEFDVDEKSIGRTVRTIHKAKGLEWDSVLVPSVNEGVFPPASGDVEESRRLLFVAITRAKHRLSMFSNEDSVSRFVGEIMSR